MTDKKALAQEIVQALNTKGANLAKDAVNTIQSILEIYAINPVEEGVRTAIEKYNKLTNPIKTWQFSDGITIKCLRGGDIDIDDCSDEIEQPHTYLMINDTKKDQTAYFSESQFVECFRGADGKAIPTASFQWFNVQLNENVCNEIFAKLPEIAQFEENFRREWTIA